MKKMLTAILLGTALVITGCTSGCSQIAEMVKKVLPAKPQSASQASVYLQKLADAAEKASIEFLDAGKISSDSAEKVYTSAGQARRYAQLARAAERAGDLAKAGEWITAAVEVKESLEKFLKDNGVQLPDGG